MALARKLSLLFIAALFLIAVQNAADNCPDIVRIALENANNQCADIGRNQVCYGNASLQANPQDHITTFNFSQPGDIESVSSLKSIRLSQFDQELEQWGIALMRIQANVPDTLPGQNVTFLLFGDVELTNAVTDDPAAMVTFDVNANTALNIRLFPSQENSVLQSVAAGITLKADGRLADNSWLRVYLPDLGRHGWVSADLLTAAEDINTLKQVDPREPVYGSMQAFYFRAGFQQPTCANVPESGILIQSPAGFGRITISVNEVQIQLDGTTFVQAEADDVMEVAVLQGNAQVIAEDTIRYVPAGAEVNIPMTNDLAPAGPPERPQPYEDTQVQELPVSNLETSVEIQPAIPVEVLYPPTAIPIPLPSSGDVVLPPISTIPPDLSGNELYAAQTAQAAAHTALAQAQTANAVAQQLQTAIALATGQPTLPHPPSPTSSPLPPPPLPPTIDSGGSGG